MIDSKSPLRVIIVMKNICIATCHCHRIVERAARCAATVLKYREQHDVKEQSTSAGPSDG